jgi:hypothetical protein
MSRYFEYFPTTTYDVANSTFTLSEVVTDISLKTALLDDIREDPYLFLPYVVKDGERAEDIADFYYGSTDYVWLVYFANDIIDPYDQWPKDTREFNQYLKMKYADDAGATDVIAYTQATTKHYKHKTNGNIVSTETFSLSANLNPSFVGGDYSAIDIYTYESEENEELRAIKLVNDSYKNIAESNLRRLLNA